MNPTTDPATVAELDTALCRLTDRELKVWVVRMSGLAHSFHETGDQRIANVFAALCVLGAEQQDHRGALDDHARQTIDGDDTGALLDDDDLPTPA